MEVRVDLDKWMGRVKTCSRCGALQFDHVRGEKDDVEIIPCANCYAIHMAGQRDWGRLNLVTKDERRAVLLSIPLPAGLLSKLRSDPPGFVMWAGVGMLLALSVLMQLGIVTV